MNGNTLLSALGGLQVNMLSIVVFGVFVLVFFVMFAHKDRVSCLDLFTSPDGRLSRTAIGQTLGVVVAVWAPVYTTIDGKLDATVMGISLAYLGGVEAYAKYLRWKSDLMKKDHP
jgi:hypothetical protein